jgi:hypothetical protein
VRGRKPAWYPLCCLIPKRKIDFRIVLSQATATCVGVEVLCHSFFILALDGGLFYGPASLPQGKGLSTTEYKMGGPQTGSGHLREARKKEIIFYVIQITISGSSGPQSSNNI